MGTFEKLGILVIVVIIVMILAVAIYQWGGTGDPLPVGEGDLGGRGETLIIPKVDPFEKRGGGAGKGDQNTPKVSGDTWKTGHPKEYVIKSGDNLWTIVTRWGLSDSFVDEVRRANPGQNTKRLRPGATIKIPDPAKFERPKAAPGPKRASATRSYEVQEGDTLGEIASKHLGRSTRWIEIEKLNPGVKPTNIRPGMKLLLPAK